MYWHVLSKYGRMAEWSKALRSGRSIFGCVGSNPTPVNLYSYLQFTIVYLFFKPFLMSWPLSACYFKNITQYYMYWHVLSKYGRMAEWSKVLRSGRSIFGCVGSNPTPVNFYS